MTRKPNVETVPGDFQKTQLRSALQCSKLGIFTPWLDGAGTGSSSRYSVAQQDSRAAAFVCVFAYGSLIWRPGFAFHSCQRATLAGYRRAFRQASSDHRGTSARPGRVVTLVPEPGGAACVGLAYLLAAPALDVLSALDHRERAGYVRESVNVTLADGSIQQAITWIAPPGNPHDAGELALPALAELVAVAEGPSGRNDEYVLRLEQALRELDGADPLVSELCSRLRAARES